MSLQSYFPEQIGLLKNFLISELQTVRVVRLDPEMKAMFLRMLARLDDDPEFPHLLLLASEPFVEPLGYFGGLVERLRQELPAAAPLIDAGMFNAALAAAEAAGEKAPLRFLRAAEALADRLPEHLGSLVFVLDPDRVADPALFRRGLAFLAQRTSSRWLKFIVLEERGTPLLDGLEHEVDRVGAQSFHLSPGEIETRLQDDLAAPDALDPAQQRQHLGLLASFAFARKKYDEAEALQRKHLAQCEAAGTPQEIASACQALGGTLFARSEFGPATGAFCRACDLSVEHKIDGLAPFAYANLGLSLHRLGELESAIASLRVARDTFKAANHRPGEAFVVDRLAEIHLERDERAEAERAWRYALKLYDTISGAAFADLRANGRADIEAKLEGMGAAPAAAEA